MWIINQYSFVIFGLAGVLLLALLLGRTNRKRLALIALAGVALIALWLAVRPSATPAAEVAQVRGQIGQGVPVLLELQSPY